MWLQPGCMCVCLCGCSLRYTWLQVQRPGAEATIALDLYILRAYSRTLMQLIGLLRNAPLDLVSVIDDFGAPHPSAPFGLEACHATPLSVQPLTHVTPPSGGLIYAEIDYEVEAANAARFSRLYSQLPNVSAPAIFRPLSTSKVLTMEWVDGARLTSLVCDPTSEFCDVDQASCLVDTLVQCTLRQMLQNGFFHADPHMGNLLVNTEGAPHRRTAAPPHRRTAAPRRISAPSRRLCPASATHRPPRVIWQASSPTSTSV